MQRHRTGTQNGLIYVLNNLGIQWSGISVQTKWTNQRLKPVAWDGHDVAHPDERKTDAKWGCGISCAATRVLRLCSGFRVIGRFHCFLAILWHLSLPHRQSAGFLAIEETWRDSHRWTEHPLNVISEATQQVSIFRTRQ